MVASHPSTPAFAPTFDLAVCIGRFQVLHHGQLALIRQALTLAPRCVVVLGSAHQARSPRNPFTWRERAEMILLALPEADRERVEFAPVRDFYQGQRWAQAVRVMVEAHLASPAHRVVLVGHFKDATSTYLNDFPAWTLHAVARQYGELHASDLRRAYFSGPPQAMEATLAALVEHVPPSTVQFLRAWAQLPAFVQVAQEWRQLDHEKALWAQAPYPPVFVTVDALVRCADQVLLIQRGRSPGQGLWALPGGFIEVRETTYQSTLRELQEETGLHLLPGDMAHSLRATHLFDHPDRSQRGRVITHAHYFDLGERRQPEVQAADDAMDARWVPIDELAAMEDQFHDDHFHILDFFLGLTG
jgi:bifunctional NMN adenylyltransferase/nudix hydrolase